MSRIHQALQRAMQEVTRPPQSAKTSAATAQQSDMSGNLESFCNPATAQETFLPGAVDSRPNKSHTPNVDGREMTPGTIRVGKKHLAVPKLDSNSLSEFRGAGQLSLSEEVREEIAKVVQRVFVFPNSKAPKVVVFSSVDKGSGSSEMCFYTGQLLTAELPGSVCLVDANSNLSLLHQFLGVNQAPGLSDAMNAPGPIKDFVSQMPGRNLWLLPAGSPGVDTPVRFSSDAVRLRMMELREEFDYVLIDAPPVASAAKTVLLGQMADGVILVVEANSTRRETARNAKETLEGASVKLLGAILNNHAHS